jgi:hypothetical protein
MQMEKATCNYTYPFGVSVDKFGFPFTHVIY